MSSDAKLHFSLKDGVFEISGSELFVSQQIESFKDAIISGLKPNKYAQGAPSSTPENKIPEEELSVPDTSSNAIARFPRVLHDEDGEIRIIKTITGNTTAKKAINTALIYLWGNRAIGKNSVPYQEIRDQCQAQACLDSGNFSSHMKSAKELFVITGQKGSSAQSCKLTLPGGERAQELLSELNDAG